jgi:ribA/ribD-fused uncharacterized protein
MTIYYFKYEYSFLSNFYLCSIRYDDIEYRSLEHAFQALKTLDREKRLWVSQADSPREAKRRGRSLVLRPGWTSFIRYHVMKTLLSIKFNYNSEISHRLISTSSEVLIEGNNWHDNFWGDCLCHQPQCEQTGANLLGWMLMVRRQELL